MCSNVYKLKKKNEIDFWHHGPLPKTSRRGPSVENHWLTRRVCVKNHDRKVSVLAADCCAGESSRRRADIVVGKFPVEFGGGDDGTSVVNHRRSADLGSERPRRTRKNHNYAVQRSRVASERCRNKRTGGGRRMRNAAGRSKVFIVIRCCTRVRARPFGSTWDSLAAIVVVFAVTTYAQIACA